MRKTGPYIRRLALSLPLCCWLLARPALAEEVSASPDKEPDYLVDQAIGEACSAPRALLAYNDEAKRLVAEQRYSLAVATFEKAYALCPWAVFLRNIAMCYQRLGQYRLAISFYRRYIVESKEQRFIGEANTNIGILTTLLEQQTSIERERKVPLWRRASFWSALGAGVVTLSGIAVAVGITSSPQSFSVTWPR